MFDWLLHICPKDNYPVSIESVLYSITGLGQPVNQR